MSKKLIFGKKQVSEQFFGGENMSKKMSSVLPTFIQVFERKGGQPSFKGLYRVLSEKVGSCPSGFRAKNIGSCTSSLHAREFSQNSHILGPTQAKIIVYS